MKIAIFSDNFYPEISGISDSVIMLARELIALGHEVHFFAAQYSAQDFAKVNLPNQELDLGASVKVHRFWSLPMFGSPTGQSRVVIPFGLRCWKFRQEKFDIIYTQSPYGMGMEALFMSRMFGIPLVGTNHTPITEFIRYIPFSNPMFNWLGLKFVSWYYNRCQFVSTPFEGILQEMEQNGLKCPGLALSNPIDLHNFFPAAEQSAALKQKFGFTDNTILYAGRIAPEKQIDVIIMALAEVRKTVPEAMLAVTGIGNAEKDLEKLSQQLGLAEAVKFFGRVDDDTHAETFRAAEIFVVMSTAETQCISMMKAMASGVPVIGADAWALPEYIGRDEKVGYVVPVGDEKKLAEKIVELLQNPEKRLKMGQAGLEYVKQFSAKGVAQKWQEIFENESKK